MPNRARSRAFRAAAIDLGGSGGRVVGATVADGRIRIDSLLRFPNHPVTDESGLHWDAQGLFEGAVAGLGHARAGGPLDSVGVDAWSGDYGLVGPTGLIGLPFSQRDPRTRGVLSQVDGLLPADSAFRETGVATTMPWLTLYQLATDLRDGRLDAVDRMLLLPDLLAHWLGGDAVAEATNVSSTGLALPLGADWDHDRILALGLPPHIFPPVVRPGTALGRVRAGILPDRDATAITAVASHDTASAVAAVPAANERFAYVSCGTWTLIGVETARPITTEAARSAGFTNELGIDGTVRFLRIAAGLSLLNECIQLWEPDHARQADARQRLLAEAASVPPPRVLIDPGDPRLHQTRTTPERIAEFVVEAGGEPPAGRAELVRLILESLGAFAADQAGLAADLSGIDVRVIHLVGGGAQTPILAQAIADRSGLPVVAGPHEATALGNILIQARASGAIAGERQAIRNIVGRSVELQRYLPRRRP